MEKNTVLLQDTEAFMHGELDNVTVQQNCIVLDLVQGGVLAYSLPDERPHATTAHRQFSYVEPTQGGILLEHGDTPRKYTVYAIGTDGRMIVGDVTV